MSLSPLDLSFTANIKHCCMAVGK